MYQRGGGLFCNIRDVGVRGDGTYTRRGTIVSSFGCLMFAVREPMLGTWDDVNPRADKVTLGDNKPTMTFRFYGLLQRQTRGELNNFQSKGRQSHAG